MHVDSLVKKISVKEGKFFVETEPLSNDVSYAFYLVGDNFVEKKRYSDLNTSIFQTNVRPGEYKAVFFYKSPTEDIHISTISFDCTDQLKIVFKVKRFFIYGGCVSRDIFNAEYDKNSIYSVENYYARYSIAKLTSDPYAQVPDLKRLASSFQRRMVLQDLKNDLLESLSTRQFDVLLVDFLTTRLRLAVKDNSIITCSNELINSGFLNNKEGFEFLTPKDERYWYFWEIGFNKLIKFLREKGLLKNLLIQKLYWAKVDTTGQNLDNLQGICQQNDILDKAYSIAEKYIGKEYFITYDSSLFIADPEHQWGPSPIHYTDEFYQTAFSKIKAKLDYRQKRLAYVSK